MSPDEYVPEADTSWGLIYRLNYLWAKADGEALNGNYGKWEIILDRIWANLLYRNDLEEDNEKGWKFSEKDIGIWRRLKKNIKDAYSERIKATVERDFKKLGLAKQKIYFSIMTYDIWLRKFMHHELRLYMKEAEKTPSGSAMFGKGFKRK